MQPPSPMPSKNWWKVRAATSGLIVSGLSDAPKEIPIMTECTTIPNSKTCQYKNYNYKNIKTNQNVAFSYKSFSKSEKHSSSIL